MDWQQWQAEMEQEIEKVKESEEIPGYKERNRFLPASDSALIQQVEAVLGQSLPADMAEFYRHFGGLDLYSVWNSYFIYTLEQMLRFSMPRQLQSSKYNGRMLIFGADIGGQSFCIFFGEESQPVLYLPDSIWEDDLCLYWDPNLIPKWLAPDFSTFLQRVLEDTRAYIRDDPDWKYMDDGLYDQRTE